MPIRLSGMASGLDTDAIIKELMSAQSIKKTKIEQKKTKLDWKQEKWAELNTKLYKLYTEQISKLRLAGNYGTKKVTSSNEDLVTATAGTSAGSGSHTLEIKNLASAQYVTGKDTAKGLKASSKLVGDAGMTAGTVIKINAGTGDKAVEKTLEITDSTTIQDFIVAMKDAGLNASFDEAQGRFFISSKNSGKENAFTIQTHAVDEAVGTNLSTKTAALIETAGLTESQASSYRALLEDLEKKQKAYDTATGDKVTPWTELQAAKKKVSEMEESFYASAANKKVADDWKKELEDAHDNKSKNDKAIETYKEIETAAKKSFYELDEDGNATDKLSQKSLDAAKAFYMKEATDFVNGEMNKGNPDFDFDTEKDRLNAIEAKYKEYVGADEAAEKATLAKKVMENYNDSINSSIANTAKAYTSTVEGKETVDKLKTDTVLKGSVDAAMADYKTALNNYNTTGVGAVTDGKLKNLGLSNITVTDGVASGDDLNVISAVDSTIILDGETLTGTSNSFTVAGITYDLKGVTEPGKTVTLNATNDTKATFDMVKNFVKEYNKLITEMNTLYGAPSSKGYEPLTDEEKEAMSDKQVELWENKIKDSLLRRDDTLNGVISAMRTSLQTSVTVNGKSYSLASFGIVTGEYTEKGLLHIYGDSEDAAYAEKENKLMKMLSENPEDAATALSQIVGNLYSTMQDKMKTSSVSSALTFYNDKEMKKQITSYNKDISKWERRLQDMEDRYYKQFSAMETAMSKLQSQSNYFSSMLGG